MKNTFTTAGMAAVAVVGFQTTCAAQAITVDDTKWWQVSASLRGFYDDNYAAQPSAQEQDSWGFEIRPGIDLAHQGEQHLVKLSLIYSARWFEDRARNEWDHTFLSDLAYEHRITENHVVRFNDTFAYSREGTLLDAGSIQTAPTVARADGTNQRNLADLRYIGQFTPLIGLEIGYKNTWYNFEDEPYSSLLDRLEHLIRAETRWTITPTLAGIVGYWYEMVDFTGDNVFVNGQVLPADIRNSDSHYIVAGVDYTVSPQTFLSVRGGAQNVMYDNYSDYVPGVDDDDWNAFGDISGTYEYLEDSYVRLGFKYGRSRTDYAALDQEVGTVYGVVNHQVMENLAARFSGQLQYGKWETPGIDIAEDNEGLYLLGVSLIYDLSQYLAVEGGYNYDRLDSDAIGRSYSRNRVFLGVRGQF
jgi:hypothetical protein